MWYLHNQKGPECDLFRAFCEKGHYGGRTKPTNTRQGIYAVAPSGEFLASVNTNDAKAMARMLTKALEAWDALPKERRFMEKPPAADPEGRWRTEKWHPSDGLVLRQFVRDLPREKPGADTQRERYFTKAWNQDFAWFRKAEARSFLPEKPEAGARRDVPEALVRRLARFHLIDIVRGQTSSFPDACVEKAELSVEVTAVEGDVVSIKLAGATTTRQKMSTGVKGYGDMNDPKERERGYEAKLLGRATYDLQKEKFVAFELVAVGSRWGGTLYNGRGDDLDPAPMGIVFTLAGEQPADHVAPAFVWEYGWK